MNVTVIEKLEKGWIKMDWKETIHRVRLGKEDMSELVDKVDRFKGNRSAKEIILFRYKGLPVYVTIQRKEYGELLDWLMGRFIEMEWYEGCVNVTKIKSKIKSLVNS
jgi:hypothetical protein